MKYDLTPTRKAEIKRLTVRSTGVNLEQLELSRWLWDCKIVQPFWKAVWRFLIKLSINLACDPAISLLSVHPREMKTCPQIIV